MAKDDLAMEQLKDMSLDAFLKPAPEAENLDAVQEQREEPSVKKASPRPSSQGGGKGKVAAKEQKQRIYFSRESRSDIDAMYMAYKLATNTSVTLGEFIMEVMHKGFQRLPKEVRDVHEAIRRAKA